MKIKRQPTKRIPLITKDVANLVEKLISCNEPTLIEYLEPLCEASYSPGGDTWPYGRSDLFHWIPLLDRFDEFLCTMVEQLWSPIVITNDSESPSNKTFAPSILLVQATPFSMDGKRLVLAILGFTRLLLENCSSRNIYASYDRLRPLLATLDIDIFERTLELLILPARKIESQVSLRATFDKHINESILGVLAGVSTQTSIDATLVQSIDKFSTFDQTRRQKWMSDLGSTDAKGQQLQRVHLLSLSLYLLATQEMHLDTHIFANNPTIITDTARQLSASPPGAIQRYEACAITLLRASIKLPTKWGEIVYAINLGAGHAAIASIVRSICSSLSTKSTDEKWNEDGGEHQGSASKGFGYSSFYLGAFLDFLHVLATTPETDEALVSSGIVGSIIRILDSISLQPQNYHRVVERLLSVIDALNHRSNMGVDAFFVCDGVGAIVKLITHVVDASIMNIDGNKNIDDDSKSGDSHISLPVDPSNIGLLNSCLKIIDRLVANGGVDDRLRNLIEGSLFKSLKVIFERQRSFGADTMTIAVNILSNFIHNEPTSLSILQEQNISQSFIDAISDYVFPSTELLGKLPHAFSATCLNSSGSDYFQSKNPLETVVSAFLDPEYTRCLRSHSVCVVLGNGIDEFMRHHPQMKEMVKTTIIQTLDRFPHQMALLRNESSATWKGLAPLSMDVTNDIRFVDNLNAFEKNDQGVNTDSTTKTEPNPISAMFELFCMFVEGAIQQPAHIKEFVAAGLVEKLFKVYLTPGLPFDFVLNSESFSISHLFRLINESEPTVLLEAALVNLSSLANDLDEFLERTDWSVSLFEDVIKGAASVNLENKVLAKLISALSIIGLFCDLYIRQSYTMAKVANTIIASLSKEGAAGKTAMLLLGLLFRVSIWEYYLLLERIPEEWSASALYVCQQISRKQTNNNSTLRPNGPGPLDNQQDSSMSDVGKKASTKYADPADPRIRNYVGILYVLQKIPMCVMTIFGGISKMISGGRTMLDFVNEENLVGTASLLANCTMHTYEWLSQQQIIATIPERVIMSIFSTANFLCTVVFFDDTKTIQTLPMAPFAVLGGLDVFRSVLFHILQSDLSQNLLKHFDKYDTKDKLGKIELEQLYGWQEAVESTLLLFGRITNKQVYKGSSFNDLALTKEPEALCQYLELAADIILELVNRMVQEAQLIKTLGPDVLRLLLTMIANVLPSPRSIKTGEDEFQLLMTGLTSGQEEITLAKAKINTQSYSQIKKCQDYISANYDKLLGAVLKLYPGELTYDAAVIVARVLGSDEDIPNGKNEDTKRIVEWLCSNKHGSLDAFVGYQILAILANGYQKERVLACIEDKLEAIITQAEVSLSHLAENKNDSYEQKILTASFLLISLYVAFSGIPTKFDEKVWKEERMADRYPNFGIKLESIQVFKRIETLSIKSLQLVESIEEWPVDFLHSLLMLIVSITRNDNGEIANSDSLNFPKLIRKLVSISTASIKSIDIRHRAMVSLCAMILRHFVEAKDYLSALMEHEARTKMRSLNSTEHPYIDEFMNGSNDVVALRNWNLFLEMMKRTFTLKPEPESVREKNAKAESEKLILKELIQEQIRTKKDKEKSGENVTESTSTLEVGENSQSKDDVVMENSKKALSQPIILPVKERLMNPDLSPFSPIIVNTLIEFFIETDPLYPQTESVEQVLASEKDEKIVESHFLRCVILLFLNELITSYPVCHEALVKSEKLKPFLERLVGRMVPCGVLGTNSTGSGGNGALNRNTNGTSAIGNAVNVSANNSIFVNGPVWVDHFLVNFCIGSQVATVGEALSSGNHQLKERCGILVQVFSETLRSDLNAVSEYQRLSRMWCLNMSVGSLLNSSIATSDGNGSLINRFGNGGRTASTFGRGRLGLSLQLILGGKMLENGFVGLLTGNLEELDKSIRLSGHPCYPVVASKIMSNLETLGRLGSKQFAIQRPANSFGYEAPTAIAQGRNNDGVGTSVTDGNRNVSGNARQDGEHLNLRMEDDNRIADRHESHVDDMMELMDVDSAMEPDALHHHRHYRYGRGYVDDAHVEDDESEGSVDEEAPEAFGYGNEHDTSYTEDSVDISTDGEAGEDELGDDSLSLSSHIDHDEEDDSDNELSMMEEVITIDDGESEEDYTDVEGGFEHYSTASDDEYTTGNDDEYYQSIQENGEGATRGRTTRIIIRPPPSSLDTPTRSDRDQAGSFAYEVPSNIGNGEDRVNEQSTTRATTGQRSTLSPPRARRLLSRGSANLPYDIMIEEYIEMPGTGRHGNRERRRIGNMGATNDISNGNGQLDRRRNHVGSNAEREEQVQSGGDFAGSDFDDYDNYDQDFEDGYEDFLEFDQDEEEDEDEEDEEDDYDEYDEDEAEFWQDDENGGENYGIPLIHWNTNQHRNVGRHHAGRRYQFGFSDNRRGIGEFGEGLIEFVRAAGGEARRMNSPIQQIFSNFLGEARAIGGRQFYPMSSGTNPSLLISMAGNSSGTFGIGGGSWASRVAGGRSTSEIYLHPWLQRPIECPPVSGSLKNTDLALLSGSGVQQLNTSSALSTLASNQNQRSGTAGGVNSDLFRIPMIVYTHRRWNQEGRIFFGESIGEITEIMEKAIRTELSEEAIIYANELYGAKKSDDKKMLKTVEKEILEADTSIIEPTEPILQLMEDNEGEGSTNVMQVSGELDRAVSTNLSNGEHNVASNISAASSEPIASTTPIEPVIYEDPGPDPTFLEALPFEMRPEVLLQYFAERRRAIPQNATEISINPQFLARLSQDLRDDYLRLSQIDVDRWQRRRRLLTTSGGRSTADGLRTGNVVELEDFLGALDPNLRQIIMQSAGLDDIEVDFDEDDIDVGENQEEADQEMDSGTRTTSRQAQQTTGMNRDLERLEGLVNQIGVAFQRLTNAAAGGNTSSGGRNIVSGGSGNIGTSRLLISSNNGASNNARPSRLSISTATSQGAIGGATSMTGNGHRGEPGLIRDAAPLLDLCSLTRLLRHYYIPGMQASDRRTLNRLFQHICTNEQRRTELISMIVFILEQGPADVEGVEKVLEQYLNDGKLVRSSGIGATEYGSTSSSTKMGNNANIGSCSASKNPFSSGGGSLSTGYGAPSSSTVVILQRTLQLLLSLVSHNEQVQKFFTNRCDAPIPWTIHRRVERRGGNSAGNMNSGQGTPSNPNGSRLASISSKTFEIRYPIVILMASLENPMISSSGLLTEHLVHLIAIIAQPIKGIIEVNKKLADAKSIAEVSDKTTAESKDATTNNSSDTTSITSIPEIPIYFLHVLVRSLTTCELTPKAFGYVSQIFNLISLIDACAAHLMQELSDHPGRVLETLGRDLKGLKTAVEDYRTKKAAASGFGQSDKAMEKLTIAGKSLSMPLSSQTKLLRLVKMMSSIMFKGMAYNAIGGGNFGSSLALDLKKEVCGVSWDQVGRGLSKDLWKVLCKELSECLSALEQDDSLMHIALGLLPAIESYFLYERQVMAIFPDRVKIVEERMGEFGEAHRKILNTLIRMNHSLLGGSFGVLIGRIPRILDFDNKRYWFNQQVHKRGVNASGNSSSTDEASLPGIEAGAAIANNDGAGNVNITQPAAPPAPTPRVLSLNVRRAYVFEDSFHQIMSRSGDEVKYGKISVRFYGEQGVDAGGVTREWFEVLSRQMFNPDYALFKASAADRITYQPNRMSYINPDHLQYFTFVGRVIGKAIYDGRLLDCYFTRSFYKHILSIPVDMKDLEATDPDFYKSLVWILENEITDVMSDLTFSIDTDEFGVQRTVDLKPNGHELEVTESNKREYVQAVIEYRLTGAIKPQLDAFLKGFHEIIPARLISLFNEQELELLISGMPEIDIEDWRANTEYHGYTVTSPVIQWFWRAVRSFDSEQRAKLVQFVTGTSKVPLEGFAHLQGSTGLHKFTIHRDWGDRARLPSAHTCFNQLDLPEYDGYEVLRDMLLKVINEATTGFGFA